MSLRARSRCWAGIASVAVGAALAIGVGLHGSAPADHPRVVAHAPTAHEAGPALLLRPHGTVVALSQPDEVTSPPPAATATPAAAPPPAAPTAPPETPAVSVAPPAPVAPAAAPRNRLVGPDGLDTAVGAYSDCTGQVPLPAGSAAIDTCVADRQFFVGHNPGVFTPLTAMGVGAVVTWYDGDGTPHPLRVIQTRTWQHVGLPALAPGATAQFQTCIVPDGSVDMVLDAAPA